MAPAVSRNEAFDQSHTPILAVFNDSGSARKGLIMPIPDKYISMIQYSSHNPITNLGYTLHKCQNHLFTLIFNAVYPETFSLIGKRCNFVAVCTFVYIHP